MFYIFHLFRRKIQFFSNLKKNLDVLKYFGIIGDEDTPIWLRALKTRNGKNNTYS